MSCGEPPDCNTCSYRIRAESEPYSTSMFVKEPCVKCGEKIEYLFTYCPYCGFAQHTARANALRKKKKR